MTRRPAQHLRQHAHDSEWVLTLLGTAVGIGILFLPIQASQGGLWPILILAGIALPILWLSHRTLAFWGLASQDAETLSDLYRQDFGKLGGWLAGLLFCIVSLSIVTASATAMLNLAASFIENQLLLEAIPRLILCLLMALALTAILLTAGKEAILRISSAITFPLIMVLLFLSLYLIPNWRWPAASLAFPSLRQLLKHGLLIFPLLMISMDFWPICARMAASFRRHYPGPQQALARCNRSLFRSSLLLWLVVIFFVFSCLLAAPGGFQQSKPLNVDVLTQLSLAIQPVFLQQLLPLIALATLLHAYFAAFINARNVILGFIRKHQPPTLHALAYSHPFEWILTLCIALAMWWIALSNPVITAVIGWCTVPVMALLAYVLPVIALYCHARKPGYRSPGDWLVLLVGFWLICSTWLGNRL